MKMDEGIKENLPRIRKKVMGSTIGKMEELSKGNGLKENRAASVFIKYLNNKLNLATGRTVKGKSGSQSKKNNRFKKENSTLKTK